MKETLLRIAENIPLTRTVYRMTLTGEELEPHRPGQFVNLQTDGYFLRRPVSVADQEGDTLRLIYKVVGAGTAWLSIRQPGENINALTGLGNGYDLSKAGEAPLLLGGGVGVPPLIYLARKLRQEGRTVTAVLGFNTAGEVFGPEDFEALGCRVILTTADGSRGQKGFVTDALPEHYSYVYTCGPEAMLRAVFRSIRSGGQFSFEERMGCGFGACMGCSCRTVTGWKRICREGPVLEKEEILWNG